MPKKIRVRSKATDVDAKSRRERKRRQLARLEAKLKNLERNDSESSQVDDLGEDSDAPEASFQDVASSTHQQTQNESDSADELEMSSAEPNSCVLPTFRHVLRELLVFIDFPTCGLDLMFSKDDWILAADIMPDKRIDAVKKANDDDKLDVFFKQLEEYKQRKLASSEANVTGSEPTRKFQRDATFQAKVKQTINKRLREVEKFSSQPFKLVNTPRKILKPIEFSNKCLSYPNQHDTRQKRKSCETDQLQVGEPCQKLLKWAEELRADDQNDLAEKLLELSSPTDHDASVDENSSLLSNSFSKFAADQVMNNWKFASFTPSQESNFIVGEFRRYVEKFNMFADNVGCIDSQKQILLQFNSGETISKAVDAVICRGKSKFSSFQDVVDSLIEYWSRGTDNIAVETFFKSQKQKDGQSFTDFLESLRNTSYNVTNIFSQANPEIARENMILHTFADGIHDESLKRFANELAVMNLKSTTKSTTRLDRLEGKTIAADKNISAPQNMFEVKRVSNFHDQPKPTFNGENERNYKFNSTVPGAQRGRGLTRSFGYRQSDSSSASFSGRQYRGQNNEAADEIVPTYSSNFCERCKKHGHRTRQLHRCPMASRQLTSLESKGQYTTESFARPQGNMFARSNGNMFARSQGNTPNRFQQQSFTRSGGNGVNSQQKSDESRSARDAAQKSQSVKFVNQSEHEEVSDDFESAVEYDTVNQSLI